MDGTDVEVAAEVETPLCPWHGVILSVGLMDNHKRVFKRVVPLPHCVS